MKSRTTWVLVVIALVIGGFVALDYYKGTSTEEALAKSKRLLDFQSKDITGLKIELTNHVYALTKVGDRWQIKQPLNVRANDSTVSSILDELEFAERNRTITRKELGSMKPAEFGLQSPRARVTLQARKGEMVLLVGNDTPTKDAVYAQVQGSPDVLVTSKSVYDRVNRTLDDLRDRTVVDFEPASATRLEIRSADRVIELARSISATNSEARWALTRPLAARADQRKVSELLTDLNELRVTDFVSEDPKDIHTYQLDEPEREITVWTGDSGKTVLLGRPLTNDASKVYAKLKSGDSIYTVPASTAQKFAVQANDLRDPQVLLFSEDGVRGIDVLHGTDKVSLIHTDSTWRITAPTAALADETAVRELLEHLGNLNARQFTADVATDLDKYGLAAPTTTVSLRGDGTNVLAQLLVGSLDASNAVCFVKRADEPFVYGVDTNIMSWLPANYLALRSRSLASLKADDIVKLVVEKKAGRVTLQRGADKKWQLVEPAQGVLDDDALQHVLDEFAALRAEEFIREGRDNLAEYGLDEPDATLTATAGDKTYTLMLGKPAPLERRFAFWDAPPLVFTVSASGANTLLRDVVKPATPISANAPPPTVSSPTNAITPVPATAMPTNAPGRP